MKVSTIIDKIFLRIILLLIIYIVVGFYTGDNFSAIASGVMAIFILELAAKALFKHPSKRTIKKSELKENENFQKQLLLSTKKQNVEICFNAFKNYDDAVMSRTNIQFIKNEKKYIVYTHFAYDCLSKQNVLDYYKRARRLNKDICVILTGNINRQTYEIIGNFKDITIKILADFEVYSLLKKENALPEIQKPQKAKPNLKKIFSRAFNKISFKGYFLCSAVLFGFSFITPFKFYYRISTIFMLLLALICLIKKQPKIQDAI